MSKRVVRITLEVEIPENADAYTVEDLVWRAGRQACHDALARATTDESVPAACPRCEKRGSSGTEC